MESFPTKLLCSTGAFSRYPEFIEYERVLEYGPQLEVDGFEVMFQPSWYPDIERIGNDFQRSGLHFPVIHAEKNIGAALGSGDPAVREKSVRWLAENCRLGRMIDAKTLILHLWGMPELDDDLEHNLQPLTACLDIGEHFGIELLIETIPSRQRDPLSNVLRAVECDARARVALDTEFLAWHGQLEEVFSQAQREWLWQQQRVGHVHVKDYDEQAFFPDGRRRYLHPGEGHIDFTSFFARLRQQDFRGTISLESPSIDNEGRVDIRRLQASLDIVRGLMSEHV